MKKQNQKLIIDQIDRKLARFRPIALLDPPSGGWIRTVRAALGMSLRQLGERMKITSQSVKEMEQRELAGTISLKSLQDLARALNMKLVYGLVPMEGSLNTMVERQAMEVARKIVLRTSQTMKLEDQGVGDARLKKAIKEMASDVRQEMPRYLWDLK
jgi:predicted DNA-binding mobile mystery protein A